MNPAAPHASKKDRELEKALHALKHRIDQLKTEYNLFFSGEIRIPPEKEREAIQQAIRKILQNSQSNTSRSRLLINNISSTFSLYNNMWQKRMTEKETGVSVTPQRRHPAASTGPPRSKAPVEGMVEKNVNLNLNNENSFNFLVKELENSVKSKRIDKDKIINNLKVKMISENIISARASLSVKNGKVKIKIKRSI